MLRTHAVGTIGSALLLSWPTDALGLIQLPNVPAILASTLGLILFLVALAQLRHAH
jgi:hypothetical protein